MLISYFRGGVILLVILSNRPSELTHANLVANTTYIPLHICIYDICSHVFVTRDIYVHVYWCQVYWIYLCIVIYIYSIYLPGIQHIRHIHAFICLYPKIQNSMQLLVTWWSHEPMGGMIWREESLKAQLNTLNYVCHACILHRLSMMIHLNQLNKSQSFIVFNS